ncbi:extracellular solute-binding protein [Bailinhaonella thermotolerans]|uniref:Extracellular solute-binding protein n=2 Tax=Bailinhaonella thermotolerans TaxID=1070861 RepID=A0A3A4AUW7_9ACTN|nr:extracellular solute-binding protein [Bailinhaonella thermotolerans]
MKIRTSMAVIAATALPLLTACGATPPAKSEQAAEITLWSFVKASDTVVKTFNESRKGFRVKLETVPSGPEYYSKLSNAVKAGTVPDVALVEFMRLPEVVSTGQLEDLTASAGPLVAQRFPAQVRNLVELGQKTWAVPRDVGPMMLYYRKDFFAKHKIDVPATWEEYREAAGKAKKADPRARAGVFWNNDASVLTGLAWQAGAKWFRAEGGAWRVDLDGEPSRKVAAYWESLVKDDLVRPLPALMDAFWQSVKAGETVAYVCASWCAGGLQATVPDQKGKWALAPLPTWDGKPASGMYGGSAFGVPKGAKHAAQAMEFIKWITTDPEGMKAWVSSGTSSMFPADPALVSVVKQSFKTDYFGGQDIYATGATSYDSVLPGWTWGPAMGTTFTSIIDSLGKMQNGSPLSGALTGAETATVSDMKSRGLSAQS